MRLQLGREGMGGGGEEREEGLQLLAEEIDGG